MEKVQLKHPEDKKAVSMESGKYDALKASFIRRLQVKKNASFIELLVDVTLDLQKRNITVHGVIQWNLFWVTLDMEANHQLKKDKTVSPYQYSL